MEQLLDALFRDTRRNQPSARFYPDAGFILAGTPADTPADTDAGTDATGSPGGAWDMSA